MHEDGSNAHQIVARARRSRRTMGGRGDGDRAVPLQLGEGARDGLDGQAEIVGDVRCATWAASTRRRCRSARTGRSGRTRPAPTAVLRPSSSIWSCRRCRSWEVTFQSLRAAAPSASAALVQGGAPHQGDLAVDDGLGRIAMGLAAFQAEDVAGQVEGADLAAAVAEDAHVAHRAGDHLVDEVGAAPPRRRSPRCGRTSW